ncbi:hypothetical protein [Fodinibius sp. AD559]|uniref:hypothetical protein n=1 Tax=Fodinibius sp. AD559 TaxID=3424179 RepID=UPI004046905B
MKTSKFTFEDWENGKIPFPPPTYDRTRNAFKTNYFLDKPGLWPEYWASVNEPSMMDQVELDKIVKEQERVFELAVNSTVETKVRFFKWVLENMALEQQISYQENEKKRIEEKLNNDRDNISKMIRGVIPRGEIDCYTYRAILLEHQLFEDAIAMGGTFLGGDADIFGKYFEGLYKTYVHSRYLRKLEQITQEESTNNKLTKKQKLSIQAFADQMRNKDTCIRILKLFERNRDSFEKISLSASLRKIKEIGDFKNLNLPSDKTLRGWIRDYKSVSQKTPN